MSAESERLCYINDPVVAINHLLKQGKRVAYVDIDAHHGDGVQAAFYDTDKVLTISLHESGNFFFLEQAFPKTREQAKDAAIQSISLFRRTPETNSLHGVSKK